MAAKSLAVELALISDKFVSGLAKAQKSVDSFSKATGTALKAIAGYFSAQAIISGLQSTAEAFMQQERAINKMSSAMKNQGDFSRAALEDMEVFASQIQATTTVADEHALAMMANLKSYGMLNDEVKRAAQVAIDFASAKREEGMTIEAASELIGKAYMGQTDRLKRYGIVIDTTLKGVAAFNAVPKQLNERFGGSAAAELQTYEGRWKNIGNQFGEVKEKIGALVLEISDLLMPALKWVAQYAEEAAEGISLLFSKSEKAVQSRKRMGILGEIEEAETELIRLKELVASEGKAGSELQTWKTFATGTSLTASEKRIPVLEDKLIGALAHRGVERIAQLNAQCPTHRIAE